MRTAETTVFKFDELSNGAKEKARECFRRGNEGDNFFSKSVIEDAATIAALFGLDIPTRAVRLCGGGTRQEPCVYWSGFSSRGDGACVEGTWRAGAVQPGKVKEHVGDSEPCREIGEIAAEFERLAAEFPDASFTVRHRGHYSHENCTVFNFSFDDEIEAERDLSGAEESLTGAARGFMRWIYSQLERKYEWTNSDEQVDESIRANEYEFEEDGSPF